MGHTGLTGAEVIKKTKTNKHKMSFLKEVLLQWIVGVPGPSKAGGGKRLSKNKKYSVYKGKNDT